MNFKAIRKSSAPEMVAEQILERVKSGDLTPGERLPSQRELATLLGVGRSSIREAINALAVMGYLDVAQGRGTYVKSDLPDVDVSLNQLNAALKAGSILDLMDVRELLESRSAYLAAERAEGDKIEKIRSAIKGMKHCGSGYERFLEADMRFHMALAQASENRVLYELIRLILEKVVARHAKFRTTLLSAGYREASVATARKTLSHVEAGDGGQAAKWIARHLNAIRDELKDILDPQA